MALTLAQLAKIETLPLRKGVIMNIIRDAQIMEVLPWEDVDSLESIAVRWSRLPTVAFRKLGGSYTANEGDVDQVHESVYPFGGEIEFDRLYQFIKNTIVDPKTLQTQMKLKAMALTFNDYFVNGDHGSDPDGFEGLKKRVAGMPARQTVYFAASNAAPKDPTADAAAARVFFDKLDEGHYKTNRGQVSAVLCNEGVRAGFGRVLRLAQLNGAGFMDSTKDSFDREILTYKGAPIIDMGLKVDLTTEIITDTEVAGDGGADSTSLYMVSFGTDEGVTGIQLNELDAYDPLNGAENPTAPTTKIRIDWAVGLAGFGSHGIVRLRNLEKPADWT